MTVVEAIKKWLNVNNVSVKEIEIDMLPAGINTLALMKSPTNQVEEYIDGSQKRTEYYTLYIRKESQFNDERIDNNACFEDLENKVMEWNLDGNLPQLDGKRYCDNISISGTTYLFQSQENESIYSLTFEIIYRKEA
ncbi:hypothetical protein ACR75P_08260 [Faecalicoccus pleomorphus]|uniref:hypothetical protein n=1 Tax=Faecalicoccus pleomorphus TaxID=1323 RepID=UPI003DA61BC8